LEGHFSSGHRSGEPRLRAFREPTLDPSRMSVRFSFQGPRQLRQRCVGEAELTPDGPLGKHFFRTFFHAALHRGFCGRARGSNRLLRSSEVRPPDRSVSAAKPSNGARRRGFKLRSFTIFRRRVGSGSERPHGRVAPLWWRSRRAAGIHRAERSTRAG